MSHLKRHQAPVFWPIKRKGFVWTVKPGPGSHPVARSMPLVMVLRDVLKFTDKSKEASAVIKQGKVLVDKKPVKDPRHPIGLMDSLEIPDAKKYLRVLSGPKGLEFADIPHEELSKKTCRIEGKKTIKGGQIQLSLHDGRNIIVNTNDYVPGDSLVIEVPEQNIVSHMKFEIGSKIMIISGKNVGLTGTVDKMLNRKTLLEQNRIIVQSDGGKIETLKKYAMVVGDGASGASDKSKPKKHPQNK